MVFQATNKGETYGNSLLSGLKGEISKNRFIKDYDSPVSRRIKLNNSEEEIDLLVRIGDLILLGEAKSIVTTDSPISQYRTFATLQKASEQASRKTDFVYEYIEDVFRYLGWQFEEGKSYKVINCIINSGRMYVGHTIEGIPVVDEKILNRYFSSKTIPYMSTIDQSSAKEVHLAWFNLYSDFQSLKDNLEKYLNNPPHITVSEDDFEFKSMRLPCVSENSFKIIYNRLVPKEISKEDILKKEHRFPLSMVDNIEEEISKMKVTF